MSDITRNLSTVRVVNALHPIADAEFIERAEVDGWSVVVKKGEFRPGDSCVFFEIDSFIPATDTRFDFLAKTKRTWKGKDGYRLKTIKLKKTISQGLALPTSSFAAELADTSGKTLDELLGIEKWEDYDENGVRLAGNVKSTFPVFIRKTDQERCVHADTLVITPAGRVKISSLRLSENPQVLGADVAAGTESFRPVTAISCLKGRSKRWFTIVMDTGERLCVTAEHPVFLAELHAYRQTHLLSHGDVLLKTDQA